MAHPHRASGLLWPAMRNSNANIIKKLLNPPCRTIIFMFWQKFGHASFPHSTRRTPLKPAKQFYKHRAARPPRPNALAERPILGCRTGCFPRQDAPFRTAKRHLRQPAEAQRIGGAAVLGRKCLQKRRRESERGDGWAYPLHSSMARSCASSTSMRSMAKPARRASSMGRVYKYCISMGRPRSQSTFMLGE